MSAIALKGARMTEVRPLSWGRKYLMCRPEHFRVDYAINPWMDVTAPVDTERALAQWDGLVDTIRAAGAEVEVIAQRPDTPDMVYAMNYGILDGDHVAITAFRHPERRPETESAEWWFGEAGLRTTRIADTGVGSFEAGDAFLFGDTLLVADGPRTDRGAHDVLARTFDVSVTPVGITSPWMYHLDLSFCPLDQRRAIVAPWAWDAQSWRRVAALVPEPLIIDEDEANTFCANSIVVDETVIMPAGVPVRVARQLEAWGFSVAEVAVDELHKGGGSVRCMTLPLDTVLEDARRPAASQLGIPAQSSSYDESVVA
jgi:N-dimethylarginine dimethylaminohydrolase